ncbi:MAG: type II toxin-antitoxin system PrlF family antitoxin [Candidatus Eremiobacterota bacterium]
MAYSTVTEKYQITIPKTIRNALNIKKNDKIIFAINGDQIILERVSGNILDIKLPEKKEVDYHDFKDMRENVKKWREKRLEKTHE